MEDKQFIQLEKDIKEVRDDFNSHVEIYRSNGKEIARNNQLIQDHINLDKERWEKIEPALKSYQEQDEIWEQIKPMIKDYKALLGGGRILKGVVYFLIAVGSLATIYIKLFK